jgi:hypothetical protein
MGIEFRGGHAYFYRKRWRDGRPVSEYVGGGLLALAAAERDEDARAERAGEMAAWRAERGRLEEEDRAFAEYFDRVEALASAMLTAAGYHRPKRQWRKRRVDANTTTPAPGEKVEAPPKGRETAALLERAMAGDPTCGKLLDALMELPDRGGKIIAAFGNLPNYARQVVIEQVAGENLLVRAAVDGRMDRLAAELAGPDPTPIERLLAERAAYCWLTLWKYEHHLANAKDLPSRREEFHHRRIDAAHRRYMSSLRTLAQIRKLDLPAVQVNIGGNQVNITGQA